MLEGKQPEALQKKSFNKPEGFQVVDRSQTQEVVMGNSIIRRCVLQPGWRETARCEESHTLFPLKGRMRVRMHDSGIEEEFGPKDIGIIPAGHDRWVEGNKPATILEITERKKYTELEEKKEKEAIRKRTEDLVGGMNTRKGQNFINFFAEDADVTSIMGITVCGRGTIKKYLELALRQSLTDDKLLRICSDRIRIIRPGISNVDVYWDLIKSTDPESHHISYMTGLTNLLMVKAQNEWRVLVMHSIDLTEAAKQG